MQQQLYKVSAGLQLFYLYKATKGLQLQQQL